MKFDVIIPVAAKDIRFIPTVVGFIRKNIMGADRIFAITQGNNCAKLKRMTSDEAFFALNEDILFNGLSFANVEKMLAAAGERRPSQTGWYFQQFLKFAFAFTKYAGEYYLSWDADTLPVNKIDFLDNGKPLFTKKIEYHTPYFDTMRRLIGLDKQVEYSFIAEHMLFRSDVVRELLSTIEQSHVKGNSWYEKIINACDFAEGKANLFSEFETYGNFCVKYYPDMYGTRTLNTFRAAGLIRGRNINEHIIERLSMDLHIASFEMQDAPFPYNIAWNVYRAKRKLLSILRSSGGVDRGCLDLHLSPIIVVKAA